MISVEQRVPRGSGREVLRNTSLGLSFAPGVVLGALLAMTSPASAQDTATPVPLPTEWTFVCDLHDPDLIERTFDWNGHVLRVRCQSTSEDRGRAVVDVVGMTGATVAVDDDNSGAVIDIVRDGEDVRVQLLISFGGGAAGGEERYSRLTLRDGVLELLPERGDASRTESHAGDSAPPPAPPPPPSSVITLPETPSRSQIVAAMNGVEAAVRACGTGEHGDVTTEVGVAGRTGTVTSVTVTGSFAGTPIGSCVARAVRAATFPRFRQANMRLRYPFQI